VRRLRIELMLTMEMISTILEHRFAQSTYVFHIKLEDPSTPDSVTLLDALSETLSRITGDSGRASFDPNDVRGTRSLFVVARDESGNAVGCGAFRPLERDVAELKRMYAKPGTAGVGTAVLAFLEEAAGVGYAELWLETRRVNARAVNFYLKRGYSVVPNFGKYVGNAAAICFGKRIGEVVSAEKRIKSRGPLARVAIESPNQSDVVALIGDLDAYQDALYPPEARYRLDLRALSKPNVLFAVARYADATAIGCGAIVLNSDYGEIKRMYVRPEVRGEGVAQQIIETLESTAHARGCRSFMLETGPHQAEALAFYAKQGYERSGPFGDYLEHPLSVFMCKHLVLDPTCTSQVET
jgi:putative acetyltransferase